MSTNAAELPRQTNVVGTTTSRAADEIVARLERLPFTRFHLHMASVLGVGTFFDSFDAQSMGITRLARRSTAIGPIVIGALLSLTFGPLALSA